MDDEWCTANLEAGTHVTAMLSTGRTQDRTDLRVVRDRKYERRVR